MPTLHWIGKDKVVQHHHEVPYRVLKKEYSFQSKVPGNSTGNRIIHGDNLEALKSLLPEFEGRVNCIYIDPPYNTGNEGWVYNDNVNDPRIRRWLHKVVGKEGEDLSRHDKWLCMMYPRLKLLHRLLAKDGAIFVSIDDNEVAALRLLMDEIFGAGNFIAHFVWEKRKNRENRKALSIRHDHILCFSRAFDDAIRKFRPLPMNAEALARYTNKDARGLWKSDPATAQAGHGTGSQFYVLNAPNGKQHHPPSGRCWVYTEDVMQRHITDDRIWFGESGNNVPRIKTYLHEKDRGLTPETILFADEASTNEEAKNALKDIFDGHAPFETPKPVELIAQFLQMCTTNDDLVLDSFGGSGSTGHSVLKQNMEDGGNRRFILVEMMDYAETITAERVRRVMDGYGEGNKAQAGLGGCFDFYTVGETLFDATGNLNPATPVDAIRDFVAYQEGIPAEGRASAATLLLNPYLLGETNGVPVHFVYEPQKITILDLELLARLVTKPGRVVIYADQCAVGEQFMQRHRIVFKKIPRDISRL